MIAKFCIPAVSVLVSILLVLAYVLYPAQLGLSMVLLAIIGVLLLGLAMQVILQQRMHIVSLQLRYVFLMSRADVHTLQFLNKLPKTSERAGETSHSVPTVAAEGKPKITMMDDIEPLRNAEVYIHMCSCIRTMDTHQSVYEFARVKFKKNPKGQSVDVSSMLLDLQLSDTQIMMIFARILLILYGRDADQHQVFVSVPLRVLGNPQLPIVLQQMRKIWLQVVAKGFFVLDAEEFLPAPDSDMARLDLLYKDGANFALNWCDSLLSTDLAQLYQRGVRFIFIDFEVFVSLRQDAAAQKAFLQLSAAVKNSNIAWVVQNFNDLTPAQVLIDQGFILALDADS